MPHVLPAAPINRRRLVAVLVSAALSVAALGALSPGIASAQESCNVGDFCMWIDINKGGALHHNAYSESDLTDNYWKNNNTRTKVNDNASSVYNHGTVGGYDDVRIYWDVGYWGPSFCVGPDSAYYSLDSIFTDPVYWWQSKSWKNWNDQISSYQWVRDC